MKSEVFTSLVNVIYPEDQEKKKKILLAGTVNANKWKKDFR